jgi:predicted esterase
MTIERSIAVRTHGRYLVDRAVGEPAGLLIGCHGYAENADMQQERLRTIAGAERWTCVSVQGLHRFYRGRSEDVVASWMTRQNRDEMIVDNVAYVLAVVNEVLAGSVPPLPIAFAGFSQGVATAFRAACASEHPSAVIAVGGDIPPDIDSRRLAWLRGVLIARGRSDAWYTAVKYHGDLGRLADAGASVRPLELEGGHDWTADFSRAAGAFLNSLR